MAILAWTLVTSSVLTLGYFAWQFSGTGGENARIQEAAVQPKRHSHPRAG